MTRKKSRPQHRETSPKSTNEGGFYKMFWNSMEGGNEASASPQDEHTPKSPAVIVISDSDDGAPWTIDENSGDVQSMPQPIKQENLSEPRTNVVEGKTTQNNLESNFNHLESNVNHLDVSSKTNDDDFSSLQPTSLNVHVDELCDVSINSPHLDRVDKPTSECAVQSPDTADTEFLSPDTANIVEGPSLVSQDQSSTLKNQEVLLKTNLNQETSPIEETTTELDGPQFSDVEIASQVRSISSPVDSSSIVNTVSINPNSVSIESTCDSVNSQAIESITTDIPVSSNPDFVFIENTSEGESNIVNSENTPYDLVSIENTCEGESNVVNSENIPNDNQSAMSKSTNEALELLKSLLVAPENEESLTSPANPHMDVDPAEDCNIPPTTPSSIKRERVESQLLISNETICSDDLVTSDQVDNDAVVLQPQQDSSSINHSITPVSHLESNDLYSNVEFPSFGFILPSKIKIEPSCVKRSLDLLKKELFALYNDRCIKIAFQCKTDKSVAEKVTNVEDVDQLNVGPETSNDSSLLPEWMLPCRVMMERLPTPLIRKGHLAIGSQGFKTWKSRTIWQRNEEQFRHLGVWRRGRTRLWRECQLAGMDKATYDKQVEYIKKHMITETSSSSEAESSDDELVDHTAESVNGSKNNEPHFNVTASSGKQISSRSKNKIKGFKSTEQPSKDTEGPKIGEDDYTPPQDEYVVERNTVHDDVNSRGKKTAPLKITIRKASINKSEDEREKSIEKDEETPFTAPLPANKKTRRSFVTKRTYRKPDDHDSPKAIESDPQKRKRVHQPTYVNDNDDDEESLLGRRSHEVENFNLMEKWDIPFEEPTLFRSPRAASRLAQLKTKEVFTTKLRSIPATSKPAQPSKEVKEVVEMLCSKTVEAMLCPDMKHSKPQPENSVAQDMIEVPVIKSNNVAQPSLPVDMETSNDEDMSETVSVTQEETSSTIDTSEFGDSPKKATDSLPVKKKRRKPRKSAYRRRRARPNLLIDDINKSNTDEKDEEHLQPAKVVLSPPQSTQVPVVSEGPGQSPQQSEDDVLQLRGVGTRSNKREESVEDGNEEPKESPVLEKLVTVSAPLPDIEDAPTVRVTRSKQPTITVDLDIIDNMGLRKTNKKSLEGKNDSNELPVHPTRSPKNRKGKSSLPSEIRPDENNLNTQVHEISEGPGEVVVDEPKTLLSKDASEERGNKEPEKSSKAEPIKIIPDSPMSPTPDAVENEPIQPRMTRSQKRMMREGSAYIAVKKSEESRDEDCLLVESMKKSLVVALVPVEDPEKVRESKEELQPGKTNSGASTNITAVMEISAKGITTSDTNTSVAEKSTGNSDSTATVATEKVTGTSENSVATEKVTGTSEDSVTTVATEKSTEDTSDFCTVVTNQTEKDSPDVSLNPSDPLLNNKVSFSDKKDESTPVLPCISALSVPASAQPNTLSEDANNIKSSTTGLEIAVGPEVKLGKQILMDSEESSSPADTNKTRDRKAVLEALNSILEWNSMNNKIVNSLTGTGNDKLPEKEPFLELGSASDDDECDSGDAGDALVVDEDRDFSDDDDNRVELASRIDQIIKDQIKNDTESSSAKSLNKTPTANDGNQELCGKRRDSIDDKTGLPTSFLQKLRDPRIRTKLLSRLESDNDLISNEAITPQTQPALVKQADLINTPSDRHPTAIRDPRMQRSVTDPGTVEIPSITKLAVPTSNKAAEIEQTVDETRGTLLPTYASNNPRGPLLPTPTSNPLLSPATHLLSKPREPLLPTPTSNPLLSPATHLLNKPREPLLPTPTSNPLQSTSAHVLNKPRGPLLPTPNSNASQPTSTYGLNKPRGPLLPTPTALMPTITALQQISSEDPRADFSTNSIPLETKEEIDDDEDDCLKRRPKKQKKELDTELMYKSPLEDLQSEARPTYGRSDTRRAPRKERRGFPRSRGKSDYIDSRPSRWDVRNRDRRTGQGLPCQQDPSQAYNQDRWGGWQANEPINPIQTDYHGWQPRQWPSEYSNPYNQVQVTPNITPGPDYSETPYQEPQLSYMETKLLNLSLLPKTTDLSVPPIKKIYAYFNHGNPQILRIAPPTFDPGEKASTIKMMDIGQEMIDIVQLPRPTSGLTSKYMDELPDDFYLDEIVSRPYLYLSDMMDEEVEIELHGTNIFGDSDDEQRIIKGKIASRRHINDPRNRPPIVQDKTDNVKDDELLNQAEPLEVRDSEPLKLAKADDHSPADPLESILTCLPALKEKYSFKQSSVDVSNDDSEKPVAPPPPKWNDVDLRKEKSHERSAEKDLEKDWCILSPPKKKKKKAKKSGSSSKRSRSKSVSRSSSRSGSKSRSKDSKSRSKGSKSRSKGSKSRTSRRRSSSRSQSPPPRRRSSSSSPRRSRSPISRRSRSSTPRRSRSPYLRRSRTPSSRSSSRSPKYRRGRSRSHSSDRSGRHRSYKPSRSRSPTHRRISTSSHSKR